MELILSAAVDNEIISNSQQISADLILVTIATKMIIGFGVYISTSKFPFNEKHDVA